MYVGTESGVVAAINVRTGGIDWRRVLPQGIPTYLRTYLSIHTYMTYTHTYTHTFTDDNIIALSQHGSSLISLSTSDDDDDGTSSSSSSFLHLSTWQSEDGYLSWDAWLPTTPTSSSSSVVVVGKKEAGVIQPDGKATFYSLKVGR